MAVVDVDSSSLPGDLQTKLIDLVWGLAAIWRSVCIHQMNRGEFSQGCDHDNGTINIVIGIMSIVNGWWHDHLETQSPRKLIESF